VKENFFLGTATRLIEVNGGIMHITNNELRNNGYLSEVLYTNNTRTVKEFYTKKEGLFPMIDYLMLK